MAVGLVEPGARADEWAPRRHGLRFSSALTVGGGTSEVLRNVIGERPLGLPHDVDLETGRTWREAHSTAPGFTQ